MIYNGEGFHWRRVLISHDIEVRPRQIVSTRHRLNYLPCHFEEGPRICSDFLKYFHLSVLSMEIFDGARPGIFSVARQRALMPHWISNQCARHMASMRRRCRNPPGKFYRNRLQDGSYAGGPDWGITYFALDIRYDASRSWSWNNYFISQLFIILYAPLIAVLKSALYWSYSPSGGRYHRQW